MQKRTTQSPATMAGLHPNQQWLTANRHTAKDAVKRALAVTWRKKAESNCTRSSERAHTCCVPAPAQANARICHRFTQRVQPRLFIACVVRLHSQCSRVYKKHTLLHACTRQSNYQVQISTKPPGWSTLKLQSSTCTCCNHARCSSGKNWPTAERYISVLPVQGPLEPFSLRL